MKRPIRHAKRLIVAAWGLSGLCMSGQAFSFCPPEQSPCYRFDRYTYLGSPYCRRWYKGSFDAVYLMGIAPGISPSSYLQRSTEAYDTWRAAASQVPFFSMAVNAPADTATVSYVLFVDDATWVARGINPNAAGATYKRVYPDGVVAHGRTWLHLTPQWRWSPDCSSENCQSDPSTFTPAALDFPSVMTHEFGHWLVLQEVSASGCESAMMWHDISLAEVKRDLAFGDFFGVNQLYDVPTSVGPSFTASPGPTTDTLRWEESDPGSAFGYRILVSDACWGPHSVLVNIDADDPAYTPDGRFYTYAAPAPYARAYHYKLIVLGTGERTETTSDRTMGTPPSPPSAPSNLSATAVPVGGAFRVDLSWSPSVGDVSGYYLYRHWLHLTSCAVQDQAPWTVLGPVTTTTFVDTSPPQGGELYYRVRAVNSTGGSGLSNEAAVLVNDVTAPAAVSNLSAPLRCNNDITLQWTTPGDDGASGVATAFDLRYSTSPINEANFGSATPANTPAPGAPGTTVEVQVSALQICTAYYFALKTRDEIPNWSPLSNVLTAGTTCQQWLCETPEGPERGRQSVAANLPDRVELEAPELNPGGGGSRIEYAIPASDAGAHAVLSVFDVAGRHVRTLAEGTASPGRFAVSWDLRTGDGVRVPRGMYFVRLRVGPVTLSRATLALR